MFDSENAETWMEIPYEGQAEVHAAPPPERRGRPSADEGIGYAPCRCWRCRGGVAVGDRAIYDQQLAKQLMTLSVSERGHWMLLWAAHPRHSAQDLAQLNTWLRIARGSGDAQPEYPVYSLPGAA